jgi:hypothetical protein
LSIVQAGGSTLAQGGNKLGGDRPRLSVGAQELVVARTGTVRGKDHVSLARVYLPDRQRH